MRFIILFIFFSLKSITALSISSTKNGFLALNIIAICFLAFAKLSLLTKITLTANYKGHLDSGSTLSNESILKTVPYPPPPIN